MGYPWDGQDDSAVNECLGLIDFYRRKGRLSEEAIAFDLVKFGPYLNWSPPSKARFDAISNIIMKWKDYFLSYTNRDAANTNQTYDELIKSIYLKQPSEELRVEQNFVAKVVAKFLAQNGLKGFFDYEDIRCGDQIGEEVRYHCRNSFALVQILEPESFRAADDGTVNWCLEEFREFRRRFAHASIEGPATLKDLFPVCTVWDKKKKSLWRPAQWPNDDYEEWYKKLSALSVIQLEILDKALLRQKIDEIGDRIIEVRENLFEELLSRPQV